MNTNVSIFFIDPLKIAFSLLLIFLFCPPITGQISIDNFKSYQMENGLPDNRIYSICQDQDRILWIGTAAGISTFDGENFYSPFSSEFAAGFSNQTVFGTTTDDQGQIWISSALGVYRFDKKEKKVVRIYELKDGENWCSKIIWKNNRGFFLLPSSLAVIQPDLRVDRFELDQENKIFYSLNALTFDKKGRLWFTANYQLWSFDPKTEILKKKENTLIDQLEIWSVINGKDQSILIGTRSNGLFYLDDQDNLQIAGADGQYIRSLYGEDNIIYAGGGSKGLLVMSMENHKVDSIHTIPSYPGSWTNCFYRDTIQDILWLGTQMGLLQMTSQKTNIQTVEFEIDDKGYPPYFLNFIEDRQKPDSLWIKIIDQGVGLWIKSSQIFKLFKPEIPFGKSHNAFVQDSLGHLWCTTYDFPVIKVLDPVTEAWHYPNLSNQWKRASWIFSDHQEKIWIGTEEGYLGKIDSLKGDTIVTKEIPIPDSLRSPIFGIAESSDQLMWILGEKHLLRYNQITETLDLINAGENAIFDFLCLHIDKQNNIWVGGLKGIWQLNKEGEILNKYTNINTEELTSVYKIQSDSQGMIWVGTSTGLLRIDPTKNHIRKISTHDGLATNQAYFVSSQPSGTLYIGFPKVMQTIDTRSFDIDTLRPSLQIMDFKIMDRSISFQPEEEIIIQQGQNYFTIYYAAINFRQPELNKYKYRLNGFEDNWHLVEGTNLASYSNIPPGKYTFELQGSNNDGIWSKPTILAGIKVKAPFYRQGWFLTSIGILILSLAYLFWYLKNQEKERIKKLRLQIARDLHDEIGSSLSSIAFLSEFVRQKRSSANQEIDLVLKKISETTRKISDAMSGIIWTLQDERPKFNHIIERLKSFASRLVTAQGSSLKIEIDPKIEKVNFSASQLKNIYLIVKEALNNITKYAGKCAIYLAFLEDHGHIKIIISDSGEGCNMDLIEEGNGLKNIRDRTTEMGGSYSFKSAPGMGFSIEIFI